MLWVLIVNGSRQNKISFRVHFCLGLSRENARTDLRLIIQTTYKEQESAVCRIGTGQASNISGVSDSLFSATLALIMLIVIIIMPLALCCVHTFLRNRISRAWCSVVGNLLRYGIRLRCGSFSDGSCRCRSPTMMMNLNHSPCVRRIRGFRTLG